MAPAAARRCPDMAEGIANPNRDPLSKTKPLAQKPLRRTPLRDAFTR